MHMTQPSDIEDDLQRILALAKRSLVVGRLRRPGQTKQVSAHYLHTAGGSDPIIMDILGFKSDQSRCITDPTLGMEARQQDDSRMRKLAMEVLGMTNDPVEPGEAE